TFPSWKRTAGRSGSSRCGTSFGISRSCVAAGGETIDSTNTGCDQMWTLVLALAIGLVPDSDISPPAGDRISPKIVPVLENGLPVIIRVSGVNSRVTQAEEAAVSASLERMRKKLKPNVGPRS